MPDTDPDGNPITVTPKDDLLAEAPETVLLSLVASAAYSLDPAKKSAPVKITSSKKKKI